MKENYDTMELWGRAIDIPDDMWDEDDCDDPFGCEYCGAEYGHRQPCPQSPDYYEWYNDL